MITIKILDKEYKVKKASTPEEKSKGLQGVQNLPENEGMIFYHDPPEDVSYWMKYCLIPLDIIFIDEDQEVISVKQGVPNSEEPITEQNVSFVLELNANSGVKSGDIVEFEESGPIMKVLFPDGSAQMELWGGERIISRRETKILIKKAKKADLSKDEKDYKSLGKYLFKVFKGQDERDPEYVDSPKPIEKYQN